MREAALLCGRRIRIAQRLPEAQAGVPVETVLEADRGLDAPEEVQVYFVLVEEDIHFRHETQVPHYRNHERGGELIGVLGVERHVVPRVAEPLTPVLQHEGKVLLERQRKTEPEVQESALQGPTAGHGNKR